MALYKYDDAFTPSAMAVEWQMRQLAHQLEHFNLQAFELREVRGDSRVRGDNGETGYILWNPSANVPMTGTVTLRDMFLILDVMNDFVYTFAMQLLDDGPAMDVAIANAKAQGALNALGFVPGVVLSPAN